MMKYLFFACSMFLYCSLFGQFRMVSNGAPVWAQVDATTFTATVNFHSDITGSGFNPTAIVNQFRVFDGAQQLYEVINVSNATFFSADLSISAISNDYVTTNSAPSGQIMVYNPEGREAIPQVPYASSGATAQLQAAVDTYNTKVISAPVNPVFGLNHIDAGNQGINIGEPYKAQLGNTMGVPWGSLIIKTF
jgi:hypothetical protein